MSTNSNQLQTILLITSISLLLFLILLVLIVGYYLYRKVKSLEKENQRLKSYSNDNDGNNLRRNTKTEALYDVIDYTRVYDRVKERSESSNRIENMGKIEGNNSSSATNSTL